ncbi:hypothetical protein A8F72_15085 [Burkholderia cenocepacia]|nr:hypothetical protein TQ36_16290 [Burkholderia cenocepacia]AQQ48828.1 hypothetical protein A8F32_23690 [Burkholderia cenocepacia]ONI93653.1 hypothetical protein A8F53_25035 [Burkholderia cenocepacia]ONJ09917.1 hypothetical protein A8F33_06045 [Burkholderia cenocepacia]ONJ28712.1 hypothetical protein A8F38_20760 [Burkholderia cenocepacia]
MVQCVKINCFERRQMVPVISYRIEHGDVECIEIAVFEEPFCVVSFNTREQCITELHAEYGEHIGNCT